MRFGRLGASVLGLLALVSVLASPPASADTATFQVTLVTPTGHVFVGATFDLSGSVSPAAPGRAVRLLERVDGDFQRIASQPLSADSSYDFSLTTTTVGDYVFRVKLPGTATTDPAMSSVEHVLVTTHFAGQTKTRAQSWVDAHVAYNQSRQHTNEYGTYRQDCSGYVSLAWALTSSYTTATLPDISHKVPKEGLRRGDVLLHLASAETSGHVVLFDKWANAEHSSYIGYEESPSSGATRHTIPYPYWKGSGFYHPYRRDGT